MLRLNGWLALGLTILGLILLLDALSWSHVLEWPVSVFVVVVGVITSKFGELEKKDDIKRRLDEASKFAPIEQLALSPQCGFASTEEGNILSEEEQWAKLRLAVEVASEVWGK